MFPSFWEAGVAPPVLVPAGREGTSSSPARNVVPAECHPMQIERGFDLLLIFRSILKMS